MKTRHDRYIEKKLKEYEQKLANDKKSIQILKDDIKFNLEMIENLENSIPHTEEMIRLFKGE